VIASEFCVRESVILEPISPERAPIVLYGLECRLNKADLQFLDLTFNRVLMKLFITGSIIILMLSKTAKVISKMSSCLFNKQETD